jgi:hypothetical protein
MRSLEENIVKNWKSWVLSGFATTTLALTGCAPECVDVSDCAAKSAAEGRAYTCVSGNCQPGSPFIDAGLGGGGGTTGGGGGATGGGGGSTGGGGGMTGGGGGGDAGTDAGMDVDAGTDAGMDVDAGMDAGMDVDAGMDAGMDVDAGMDAGTDVDAGTDAGTEVDAGTPAEAIAFARAVALDGGQTPSVVIPSATVTYLRPAHGTVETAGFFVQAGPTGPAIFVFVDPSTLSPSPQVGDVVSFQANTFSVTGGLAQVATISNYQRLSSGASVTGFTQDLTAVTGVATGLNDLEAELVSIRGVLDAGFVAASAPFVSSFIATTGDPAGNVKFRAPQSLIDAADLERGCDITVGPSPMWRFNTQAQVSAWVLGDVVVNSCPAPTVVSATPVSPTSVTVTFSRQLAPTSVLTDASQFAIDGGATATAAALSGRQVTLTTTPQDGGTTYQVFVANTVTDTRSTPLGTPSSAVWSAIRPNDCTASVVISQIYGGGGNSGATFTHDFIELHNRSATAVNIGGWTLHQQTGSSTTANWNRLAIPANTMLAPGGFYLIQGQSQANVGVALPTPDLTAPATGSIANFSATNAKFILTNATVTTALNTQCPTSAGIVDTVGIGSANCSERVVAPGHTNTTATFRKEIAAAELACFDTNTNSDDFVTSAPTPRNTASSPSTCAVACPGL